MNTCMDYSERHLKSHVMVLSSDEEHPAYLQYFTAYLKISLQSSQLISATATHHPNMGRAPCCLKVGLHRGAWSSDEDKLLIDHIQSHGEGHWRALPSKAGTLINYLLKIQRLFVVYYTFVRSVMDFVLMDIGLLRCGKSCRLRWMNYLRPGIKRGNFTSDENDVIIRLHSLHGNRWSLIAAELPGRTDNEIKNHWNAHLRKVAGTAANHRSKVTKNNKVKRKRKTDDQKEETDSQEKSKKVKLGQSINPHPPSSSSSSSSPESLNNNESFDNGIVSGVSSSCTIELGDDEFDFSWSNWTPLLEMEEEGTDAIIDRGLEEEGFLMNDRDLLLSKDDERLMLEKLYHEYLTLLNQEDGEGRD